MEEAKDVEKPEDEQTRLQRFVIRLRERLEQADDWASDGEYRSVASPLTQLSECCNADDLYLDAVGILIEEIDRRDKELDAIQDMVDDILYDPRFKPVDRDGNRITGADLYLLDHEIQYDHLPALRQWFVRRAC